MAVTIRKQADKTVTVVVANKEAVVCYECVCEFGGRGGGGKSYMNERATSVQGAGNFRTVITAAAAARKQQRRACWDRRRMVR